ncbi:MAG: GAF domain-containing protein [Terricaulis sp.]
MPEAPIPSDEPERLQSLHAAAILDTGPDTFFEETVEAVLNAMKCPIALVSLVDEGRQWFKARRGLEVSETDRACAFCAYTILSNEPLLVSDAREDERFADNPLVGGEPPVIAYAGAPIVLKDGPRLGTVCAVDTAPRAWTAREVIDLKEIADLASRYIELRLALLHKHRQRYLELAIFGEHELHLMRA